MYDQYRQRFGDYPTADTDVSRDQLAALRQVIQAGAVPYCDFSVFGPYGQRLLRKQSFMAYHLNPTTGDWIRREQPGPSSFHDWYRIWKCFRSGMLLLECVESERLDAYSEMVRGFVQQYGEESWPFISRADVRMRSEHLDRLRRELRANPAHGYQENHPWGACFASAIKEVEFWQKELVTPALMFMTRNKREGAPEGSETAGKPKKKTRPARRHQGEDLSQKGSDGTYVKNRKGLERCLLYGQGRCGTENAQGKCKNGRSHQCNKCLGPHPGNKCTRSN